MNKAFLLVFVVFLAGATDSFPQGQAPVRHSLVVAISTYSPGSGFRHIDADNDLNILRKLLLQQGFTDTIFLENEKATKEGFLRSFSRLRSDVHPGDIVYIHFSTHGQQITDLNNDEDDGLDEAIALYDSQSTNSNGYKGQNHLTDDEFGELIEQLRRDLGKKGDLLVMVDACHSGSMSRGLDTSIIRGGYPPIILNPKGTVTRGGDANLPEQRTKGKSEPGETKTVGMFSPVNQGKGDDLADYTILSACENDEVSSEYYYNHTYFGPLTWAFLNSMLNNNSEKYTYNKLFHDIQFEMITMFGNYRTKQTPTIESAGSGGLDRIIFGGKVVRQEPFFTISRFVSPDRIIIGGGAISGIFDSTTVTVYPAGTVNPWEAGSPAATGTVTGSGFMESAVQLNAALDEGRSGDYWVFIADRKTGGYHLSLNLGSFTSPELKKRVMAELKDFRFAEIVSDTPSYVLEQARGSRDGLVLEQGRSRKPLPENITPGDLKKTLLNVAQVQFLKSLKASSPGIDMDIRLVPSDTVHYSKTRFLDMRTRRNVVKEGSDTAFLWIVNTGQKGFYFNVIDIDPEDNFNVILPSIDRPVSECFVGPGQRFITRNTFSKPYGTETLKIIASQKKFDLRQVIHNSDKTRSAPGDIEKLFMCGEGMRGAPSIPESADLATFSFFFDVIKK